MSLIRKLVIIVVASLSPMAANATPILSGSVSFDSELGLYTYSYVLDNSLSSFEVRSFSILYDTNRVEVSPPLFHSDSAENWRFSIAQTGNVEDPPISVIGYVWHWDYGIQSGTLKPGQTLAGFSFTTDLAPSTSAANNYYIVAGPVLGPAFVPEWGRIVGPDFGVLASPPPPPVNVPEPGTLALLIIGLVGIGLARRRKRLD